ncbi:hypothetical protein IQ07DRAFT_4715 [Pyrenochaeta sp. DS3sAY3a]|nr:hypothetical protein IQ07DRAFT_4715 [Pyrenochaeta sp. DS3sAY3a]
MWRSSQTAPSPQSPPRTIQRTTTLHPRPFAAKRCRKRQKMSCPIAPAFPAALRSHFSSLRCSRRFSWRAEVLPVSVTALPTGACGKCRGIHSAIAPSQQGLSSPARNSIAHLTALRLRLAVH